MFTKKLTAHEIKQGILQRDLKVYKYLDKKFRHKTIAYVNTNNGNEQDADELYNDVIWQIYLNIENGKYTINGEFGNYFTSILKNKWIDKIRHRTRKRQISTTGLTTVIENNTIIDDGDTRQDEAKSLLRMYCLRKHLNNLKDTDRLLIKLFYFDGLRQLDIARKIDKTSEYVQQRIHKIRKRLKDDLSADPNFIK